LAQRAYRQRKESTISNLKEQVTNLRRTIEEMENIFLAYNDRAMLSGILHKNPDLAKDLKAATESFIQLAKRNHGEDDQDPSESDPEEIPRKPVGTYQQDVTMLLGQGVESNTLRSSPDAMEVGQGQYDMGLGYTQVFDDFSGPSSGTSTHRLASPKNYPVQATAATDVNMIGFSPFAISAAGSNTNPLAVAPTETSFTTVSRPVIPLSAGDKADLLRIKSLAAPYTYSFEETTFARRLQRAALERGFHLITNAELRPAAFLRVFRLSLLYHSRDTLLMKFRRSLAKSTEEPLETFQTPFIHLGGAGMHYNTGRIRNGYIVKPGPIQRRAILESTESPGAIVDIDFDISEYDGEWFDSNDVEGYLNEKGFYINPQDSFAEGQLAVLGAGASPPARIFDSPQANTIDMDLTSISASMATPPTPTLSDQALELGTQRLFPELGSASPNTLWNTAAADWLMGSGNKTPDFLESGWSSYNKFSGWDMLDAVGMVDGFAPSNLISAPQASVPQQEAPKQQVTVEVSKFIDGESPRSLCSDVIDANSGAELIKSGICLGRAPGFRKKDVDRALQAAIIQAM
jgi:hypothetical protein